MVTMFSFFRKPTFVSIYIIIAFCSTPLLGTSIKLELIGTDAQKDQNGSLVHIVGVNQQFSIRAIVDSTDQQTATPEIQGLNTLRILSNKSSTALSILPHATNRKETFEYDVVASTEGTLTLGPAHITVGGKTIESERVMVEVRKNYTSNSQQHNGQTESELICKFTSDKKNYTVGEPINVTISLYGQGNILQIGLDQKPSFDGFLVKELGEAPPRSQELNGKTYQVHEIKFRLIPLKAGDFSIPAIRVQYTIPSKRSSSRGLGHAFGIDIESFFGPQAALRHTQSESLTLRVDPLPPYIKPIDGVGNFTDLHVTLNKTDAALNEPLMLTLTIVGQGNFEQIAIPKLSLPEWFKHYESKQEISEENTITQKRFDFIIQSSKPGNVEIPQQSFTFYNPESKSFKTLRSEAISLHIKSSSSPTKKEPQTQQPEVKQNQNDTIQQPSIKTFNQKGVYTYQALPWWLFLLIIVVAPLIVFYRKIRISLSNLLPHAIKRRSHSRRLKTLEQELDNIIKCENSAALYDFFLKLLSEKKGLARSSLTEDIIEKSLKAWGWDLEKIEQFFSYLAQCAQIHFAHMSATKQESLALIKKSKYWLIMINKE